MKYEAGQMEEQAILETAAKMCAAARTAPKAKGLDRIVTLVLTGAEKTLSPTKCTKWQTANLGTRLPHFTVTRKTCAPPPQWF